MRDVPVGVIDAVSTVYPDGSTTDTGFFYGVFVVRAPNERARIHLEAAPV